MAYLARFAAAGFVDAGACIVGVGTKICSKVCRAINFIYYTLKLVLIKNQELPIPNI